MRGAGAGQCRRTIGLSSRLLDAAAQSHWEGLGGRPLRPSPAALDLASCPVPVYSLCSTPLKLTCVCVSSQLEWVCDVPETDHSGLCHVLSIAHRF